MGDTDGDGKAEVVVARRGYRIYTEPASGTSVTPETAVQFRTFGDRAVVVLTLGNFDGSGVKPPQLSASPKSLEFTMKRGGANPAAQTIQVANAGGGAPIAFTTNTQHASVLAED